MHTKFSGLRRAACLMLSAIAIATLLNSCGVGGSLVGTTTGSRGTGGAEPGGTGGLGSSEMTK